MRPVLETIEQVVIKAGADTMRATGGVVRPQLFALREGQLLGHAISRMYHKGDDAKVAIVALAAFANFLNADDVLVAWDQADLLASVRGAGEIPDAVCFARASFTENSMSCWPYRITFKQKKRLFRRTVEYSAIPSRLEWDQPFTYDGNAIPWIIGDLLEEWREGGAADPQTLELMRDAGYSVNLVEVAS